MKKLASRILSILFFTGLLVTSSTATRAQAAEGEVIPFGINNPFEFKEVKDEDVPTYMQGIQDIGFNLISASVTRIYSYNTQTGQFEIKFTPGQEKEIKVYIRDYGNYFWLALPTWSKRGYKGDIYAGEDTYDNATKALVKKHQIIKTNNQLKAANNYLANTCVDMAGCNKGFLPYSVEGFKEWRNWLEQMFFFLDSIDPAIRNRIRYIQIGNEPDDEYRKKDKSDPTNPDDYYWMAYAQAIESAYPIIRANAPQAKIAVGTLAAGAVSVGGFQEPVLKYLGGKINEQGNPINGVKHCGGSGCFDVYDYHDFSGYKEYQGKKVCLDKDLCPGGKTIQKSPKTFRKLLAQAGFSDKNLVIQQGGTYTGQDSQVSAGKTAETQSELEQASYLVKRAVYLISYGVQQIQTCTYREHNDYHVKDASSERTIHNWFTLMGLVYNGIPALDQCDGQHPCPDPGEGVKKLSWYAYQKLIQTLRGSDWQKTQAIIAGINNVYVYKFTKKDTGKPVYVAWWDYFNEPKVKSKTITLTLGIGIKSVIIREAIPVTDNAGAVVSDSEGEWGYVLNENDQNLFLTETRPVEKGKVTLTLNKKPVYLEENSNLTIRP